MSYTTGVNRLYYKAVNFAAGKTVTAYIWSPSLVKSALQTFTELELGLYYLDYNFTVTGVYAGLFYENGVVTTIGIFRVSTLVELAAEEVVTALLASTGITEGGTFTFAKALKILLARAAGNVRLKSGTTNTLEILDPDDGVTVIDEVVLNESTPFGQHTIKI